MHEDYRTGVPAQDSLLFSFLFFLGGSQFSNCFIFQLTREKQRWCFVCVFENSLPVSRADEMRWEGETDKLMISQKTGFYN